MLNYRYSAFWSLFFPARCCCCGTLTEDRALICPECLAELPHIPQDCCKRCGQSRQRCECRRINMLFSGIAVPFYNKGVAQAGIYALKMNQQRDNAQFFGICIAERFLTQFKDVRLDLVTAVPMERRKYWRTGFNHAAALAKVAARRLGVPFNGRVLQKAAGSSVAQHTLSYAARMRHVQGLYTARGDLRGKTVLLVDDIRTTAATLNACTKQLLLAGANAVYCAAALLTDREENQETKSARAKPGKG